MASPNNAPNTNAAATGGGGIWVDVRRQVIAAIVAGLIAGFVAAIGAIWAYLQTFIGSFGLVPKDAVVAFAGKCPSQGWDDYTDGIGKFIVGSGEGGSVQPKSMGDNTGPAYPLMAYKVGDQGGLEAVTLQITEIPAHQHHYESEVNDSGYRNGGNQGATFERTTKETGVAGGNPDKSTKPHNNMPPYIALTWCKKT